MYSDIALLICHVHCTSCKIPTGFTLFYRSEEASINFCELDYFAFYTLYTSPTSLCSCFAPCLDLVSYYALYFATAEQVRIAGSVSGCACQRAEPPALPRHSDGTKVTLHGLHRCRRSQRQRYILLQQKAPHRGTHSV